MQRKCCLCTRNANTLIDDLPICLKCLKEVNEKWEFWSVILGKVKVYYEENLRRDVTDINEYRKQKGTML